jgi:hypothetical protein
MTDTIKARYRESGNDPTTASTILFEIAVSIDEEDCEGRAESTQARVTFFDHLVDEYNEVAEINEVDMITQDVLQPSTE